jgi:hypothetical protein
MAAENSLQTLGGHVAGEDLNEYRGVIKQDPDQVALPSSKGDHIRGVTQNAPNNGEAATLGIEGITKMEYGEDVNSGATELTVGANGKAVIADSNDEILGTSHNGGFSSGSVGAVDLEYRGTK